MIKTNYTKIILKEGLVGLVSRSIRRPVSPKRKLKKKVLFLVEGKTEKNIIFHLFDQNDYPNISFSVEEYQGGGYVDIKNWIAKRRDSLDIVLVICDLDRVQEDTERKNLITTIKFLMNENIRNNIFLSYPDFEQWMLRGLSGSNNRPLYLRLGYANETEQKADVHLFAKYTGAGGSFSASKEYFSGRFLFYMKKDFSKGKFQEEYVNAEQSSLYYLKDYLDLLNGA